MKTVSLLALCTCCSIAALAQPRIARDQVPKPGDKLVRTTLEVRQLKEGPSGEDVVWDFSSAKFASVRDSGEFVPGPVPGTPPLIERSHAAGRGLEYRFYRYENGQLFRPGPLHESFLITQDSMSRTEVDHRLFDFSPLVYLNPAPLFRFPLKYGDQYTETFAGYHSNWAGWVMYEGSTTVVADGYGTLLLPGRRYENVLRVAVTDTFVYEFGGKYLVWSWYYFAEGHVYPKFSIEDSGNGWGYVNDFHGNEDATYPAPLVYPVPAKEEVTVDFTECGGRPFAIRLVDACGRTQREWRDFDLSELSVRLEVLDVARGLYVLQFDFADGKGRSQARKLILE